MTRSNGEKPSSVNSQLQEALAVLISCTRTRSRPLSLIEIAKWLDVAVSDLGSIEAVADRIGLSSKMLRQFSNVRRLSPGVQELYKDRRLDSVDATTHLAMLSEKDQRVAAQSLASGDINTIDLRAVVDLRKTDNHSSITSLLQKVSASKTKKEYVAEFSIREGLSEHQIRQRLERSIPSKDIVSLEIEDSIGRLALTPKGRQALAQFAKKTGIAIKHAIPMLLRG